MLILVSNLVRWWDLHFLLAVDFLDICIFSFIEIVIVRSSHSEMFLVEGVLKICSKFAREHPCRSVISVKLLKSHFGMGVLLQICCIFSEHHLLRIPLHGCFWILTFLHNYETISSLTCWWLSFILCCDIDFCQGSYNIRCFHFERAHHI